MYVFSVLTCFYMYIHTYMCSKVCVALSLQLKRERFVDELEGYSRQMSEFASFGDVDEVKRYQKRAQALSSKLDAAVDKIEQFNTEEDLFEWERSKYPQRKQLSDTLSHYSKLYDKIVDFQDKHE